MQCDLDTSVPDWLIDHPESASVFAELQIDTSCGGKSLEYVCQQRGINTATVMARLVDAANNVQDQRNSDER